MKSHILFYAVVLITTISCTTKDNDISKTIEQYYNTYQERDDFEKFLSFYDEKAVLEDMITADRIVGKKALKEFFAWDNSNYKKGDINTMVIYEQTIEENRVVTSGHFTEFFWGEQKFEAMHFVTILTFNQSGKIVRHVDWINYPSNLIDYTKRKNSNEWINNLKSPDF